MTLFIKTTRMYCVLCKPNNYRNITADCYIVIPVKLSLLCAPIQQRPMKTKFFNCVILAITLEVLPYWQQQKNPTTLMLFEREYNKYNNKLGLSTEQKI